MTLYEQVADLPLRVDDLALDVREQEVSSDFARATTTVSLSGDGATGRGEDVTYDADEHHALVESADFDLADEYTVDSFSAALDAVDLFPAGDPDREAFGHYRRWGFESAALDLALRQADATLGEVLDREYDPVRFVVSTSLGDPPAADRVGRWLDVDPSLEFKLDPTPGWTRDLAAELAATDAVRVLDLKGHYRGTDVENPADPDLYRLVVERFPDATVEDPALTPETELVLDGHTDRVSWDVPFTSVESLAELPFEPSWLNVKPSRFGTVESLFDALDYCLDRGITLYGGGQFELGVGRGQLHELASLFYPDAPNDVAPSAYNAPEPRPGLPDSPLEPPAEHRGFGWN